MQDILIAAQIIVPFSLFDKFIIIQCKCKNVAIIHIHNNSDVRLMLAYGTVHGCRLPKSWSWSEPNRQYSNKYHLQWKTSIQRRIAFRFVSWKNAWWQGMREKRKIPFHARKKRRGNRATIRSFSRRNKKNRGKFSRFSLAPSFWITFPIRFAKIC